MAISQPIVLLQLADCVSSPTRRQAVLRFQKLDL